MSQRLLFRSYAEVCLRAAEVSDSPEQKALSRQAPGNRRSNATPPPMPWLRSCASSLPTCGNKETTGKTRPPTGSAKRRTLLPPPQPAPPQAATSENPPATEPATTGNRLRRTWRWLRSTG